MSERRIQALAAEVSAAPDRRLDLTAAQLLQLISVLQVGLRHPTIREDGAATVEFCERFIAVVRDGFDGFPTIQMAIDGGSGQVHEC